MIFNVYYRSYPNKQLRCIAAEAENSESAVNAVAEMLEEDREDYYKPLIAMIVGGMHGV